MDFGDIAGATIVAIEGAEVSSEQIRFRLQDGRVAVLYHEQDCCETVAVEDVVGDITDLIGEPLLGVVESSNQEGEEDDDNSHTWTFYRMHTIRGSVVIRWLGTSNGYYSERVSFRFEYPAVPTVVEEEPVAKVETGPVRRRAINLEGPIR